MKPLTLTIFLCVAFSALSRAAERKIAYEHRDNIFVADTDGTHQKKIAAGALPEISPDGTRVAFNTEADAKTRPGPRTPHRSRRPYQWQSHGSKRYPERQLFRAGLVAGWIEARVLNHGREGMATWSGKCRRVRFPFC
jgi:hypothetical protein